MNIKQKFLTLSIRHQISLVIGVISILCLLSLLALFSLYSEIIISIQSRKRREYYNQRYKGIIDSEIQFQTFLLYQYEQLIKTFNSQIYYYGISQKDLADESSSFNDKLIKRFEETTDADYDPRAKGEDKTYFLCSFSGDKQLDEKEYFLLASTHSSIDNQLEAIRNFRITYYGSDIKMINEYIFVRVKEQILYTVDRNAIKELYMQAFGNFAFFYDRLISIYSQQYRSFMDDYKRGELNFIDLFFEDKCHLFYNYVNETFLKLNYNNNVRAYLNDISVYFHFINYTTEKTFVTDNGNKELVTFIVQNSIIGDYINIIFFKILNSFNINVIPVYYSTGTIISVNLCYAFLYKQLILINITTDENIFTRIKLDEIYNNLESTYSNLGDCIIDEKYNFKTNQNAYNVLNIRFAKFYSLKNTREFSVFKISESIFGKKYFCTKYTFPDILSILDFKPTFLTIDQINLFSFKPFYEPEHYYGNMNTFFYNCQYLIILSLFYLWVLVGIYIYIRLQSLFKEIIDPINNLSKMLNKLEIKEDMLKYEPDESINELFKLCNDLLLGKYQQKLMHDSEIERIGIEQGDNNKNRVDINNLKINRKLIEEMVENKNEYNIRGDEILTFITKDNIVANKKVTIKDNFQNNMELRKTAILKRKILGNKNIDSELNQINTIQKNIKKTNSIDRAINTLNKKLSFDINLLNNTEKFDEPENRSEEDLLEIEILLSYKHLYDLVDLTFNYEYKYDNKFISKNSKLLYKSNMLNNLRHLRAKSKKKFPTMKQSFGDTKIKIDNTDEKSQNEKEKSGKIRIEEFDKSVITSFATKSLLFLWYKEAKYFHCVEFLQNNHAKDLNNLCNLIVGNEIKKASNSNTNKIKQTVIKPNSATPVRQKKISILKKPNKESDKGNDAIRKSKTNA
jgi:hypothetical protein